MKHLRLALFGLLGATLLWAAPDELAPTGGQLEGSNGFTPDEQFADDKGDFDEPATVEGGLGPTFNGASCVECHHNPISGGSSVITELRTDKGLVHSRAVNGTPIERVRFADQPTGLRISPSLLGLAFVECIGNTDLSDVIARQPVELRGTLVDAPLLEMPGKSRVGRFGLKSQHASLLSFAADAEFNEKGVTNRLVNPSGLPKEDIEDDIDKYTRFMRSLNVPTPDAVLIKSVEAAKGASLFRQLGCGICHHETCTTLKEGSPINGGAFQVPKALGGMTIFPYSDFALHNLGTGDGIRGKRLAALNPEPAESFRTSPLWGLRFRNRFLHDGSSVTIHDAIMKHGGQAAGVRGKYLGLGEAQQQYLILFLRSI